MTNSTECLANLTQEQFFDDDFLRRSFGEAVQGRIERVRNLTVEMCRNNPEDLTKIWHVYCCDFESVSGRKRVELFSASDEAADTAIRKLALSVAGVYL